MVAHHEAAAAEAAADVDPLGLLRLLERSSGEARPEPPELLPSRLDTTCGAGSFVRVLTDNMSVRYAGAGHHGFDVGAVRADRPAPEGRLAYYFEMTVRNSGEKGCVAIGFGPDSFDLRRQPGWEENSCGYHGDNGHIYQGQGFGDPFGPTFTTGDTVGAGINYALQEFFFTKNGKLVGSVSKDTKALLYPIVALHSPNEELTLNFGQEPFLFNIEAFMLEEQLKQQALIKKASLPPNVCHWLIRSYLLHYGYQDTLDALDKDNEIIHPSLTGKLGVVEQDSYALNHRKILRQHIQKGGIDLAFTRLREWYPQVLQDELSVICFLLHLQKFIEYIRAGEVLEAVNYGRMELCKFLTIKSFGPLLEDTVALLAYNDPPKSCIQYHLSMWHREFVADAVNAAVLSTNPNLKNPKNRLSSCMENLLRQLLACSSENRDRGKVFDLHWELCNGTNL